MKRIISIALLAMMMACLAACGEEPAEKQLAQFCEFKMPGGYEATDMLADHDDKNQPLNLIFKKNEVNAFSAVVVTNTEENKKTIEKLEKTAKKIEDLKDKKKLTLDGDSQDRTAYVWENREIYLVVCPIFLEDDVMEKEYKAFVDSIKVPDSYPEKQ